MIYLTMRELLHVAERALGGEIVVRDYGLLESAARPSAGHCVRPGRLPGSRRESRGLAAFTGHQPRTYRRNERLALAALIAFYGINGRRLTMTNEASWELVTKVADGRLDLVADIAAVLAGATEPRP